MVNVPRSVGKLNETHDLPLRPMRASGRIRSELQEATGDSLVKQPKWTSEQLSIIRSAPNSRLLVDAGPGTGKTAVACARVAHLIDTADVDPNEILMITFTRAAVHEIRERIGNYLADASSASRVQIATIDSFAAKVRYGAGEQPSATESFTAGIVAFAGLLGRDADVQAHIAALRHLIVDEAQDVVSPRAEAVLDMINVMPAEAGVSVFADEAQAIYGFAEDEDVKSVLPQGSTLPDCIRQFMGASFDEYVLDKVHRTNDGSLKRLFEDGRRGLRAADVVPSMQYEKVRDLILELRHEEMGNIWESLHEDIADLDDAFILFRRRFDALYASQAMDGEPRRLRLRELPPVVHGWVAKLLWDHTAPDLNRQTFEKLVVERCADWTDEERSAAWESLVEVAGETKFRVNMRVLTQRLSTHRPPTELSVPDFGRGGPLVGTIHAAKGREANTVCLFLPSGSSADSDDAQVREEARILYVGATRARRELRVSASQGPSFSRTLQGSSRVFRTRTGKNGQKYVQVEIGMQGDLDAVGLCGRDLFPAAQDVEAGQSWVSLVEDGIYQVECERTHDATRHHEWAFALRFGEEDDPIACYLAPQVSYDLMAICKLTVGGRGRTPKRIYHLRSLGVRTLSLAPDDPTRDLLHSPWRESGLMLAPQLVALANVYY